MKTIISQISKLFFFSILCFSLLSCSDKDEKKNIIEPEIEIPLTEKMIFIITTAADGTPIKLPITGTVNCKITWDSGSLDDFETITESYPIHTYTKKGDHLILISGTVTELNSNELNESELSCISGIYNFGKTGLTNLYCAFKGCTKLTYLSNYYPDSFSDVISFENSFSECLLTIIPSDFFKNCTLATSFKNTFTNCINLAEIPSGLFDNCAQSTSFESTFSGCTSLTDIPFGLFDNCSSAISFASTFKDCSNLEEIPLELFDNCTQASNFMSTFQNCKKLIGIPSGLFSNCTQINNLMLTFAGCKNLTGESPYAEIEGKKVHLYERNGNIGGFIKPEYIYSCFSECIGLSDFSNLPNEWK